MCDWQKNNPSARIHWRFESQFWNGEVERTIQDVQLYYGIELNLTKVNTAKANKYDRILSLHPYYQNGRIFYNEKLKAHNDTAEGVAQLLGIEPGYKGHDDAPDADQQAIEWLSYHSRVADYKAPITYKYSSKNRY
jgi:hypothetical protein